MPKIFISYRRDDSQYQADRLHAALKKHVANPKRDIFIDVDNIPVGVDFVEHLDAQVAQCDVLLAVIGPSWLNSGGGLSGGRRLDDPKDFVRLEIASALKRGIPVAPILLDGVAMPREDQLPPDIKPLARRNAVEIRRQTFDADTERMIRGLRLGPKQALRAGKRRQSGWAAPVLALGALAIAGGSVAVWLLDPFGWKVVRSAATDPSVEPAAAQPPAQVPSIQTPATSTDAGPPAGAGAQQTSTASLGAQPPSAAAPSAPAPASAAPVLTKEEADWAGISRKDPAALRQFIGKYGDSSEAKTAHGLLKDLDAKAWADAQAKNTGEGYSAYLRKFPPDASPPGAMAAEAADQIVKLHALASADSQVTQAYLDKLNNDRQRAEDLFKAGVLSKADYDKANEAYWSAIARAFPAAGAPEQR